MDRMTHTFDVEVCGGCDVTDCDGVVANILQVRVMNDELVCTAVDRYLESRSQQKQHLSTRTNKHINTGK